MSGQSEYKVEKDHFNVKVFFLDGTIKDGNIFLSHQAAHHEGHELVIDVLNQREQFIPISFSEGSTRLINKSNLLMISFPSVKQEPDYSVLAGSSVEVAIHLNNHTQLEGNFIFDLPSHARRVKDFLNQSESYLELRKDGETYLINKNHVLFIEEK